MLTCACLRAPCRYEDNFDAVSNMFVIVEKTDKTSIEGYGTPEKFLEQVSYLLGKQSFSGELPHTPVPARRLHPRILQLQHREAPAHQQRTRQGSWQRLTTGRRLGIPQDSFEQR